MFAALRQLAIRLATVFLTAAFLAYATWVVTLIESTQTWSGIALAAILLAAPILAARFFGLRLVSADGQAQKNQETREPPPLLGLELGIPEYQCQTFALEIAALTGAGARVVAVDSAEFRTVGLVKPDGYVASGPAMLAIVRKEAAVSVSEEGPPLILTPSKAQSRPARSRR
jgi:hypothetical protein